VVLLLLRHQRRCFRNKTSTMLTFQTLTRPRSRMTVLLPPLAAAEAAEVAAGGAQGAFVVVRSSW
jgi:hypothetical protein